MHNYLEYEKSSIAMYYRHVFADSKMAENRFQSSGYKSISMSYCNIYYIKNAFFHKFKAGKYFPWSF